MKKSVFKYKLAFPLMSAPNTSLCYSEMCNFCAGGIFPHFNSCQYPAVLLLVEEESPTSFPDLMCLADTSCAPPHMHQTHSSHTAVSFHFYLDLRAWGGIHTHRTAWVEKDHNNHQFQPPCCVQGRQPPDQTAQSHIQPGLEHLEGWGIWNSVL